GNREVVHACLAIASVRRGNARRRRPSRESRGASCGRSGTVHRLGHRRDVSTRRKKHGGPSPQKALVKPSCSSSISSYTGGPIGFALLRTVPASGRGPGHTVGWHVVPDQQTFVGFFKCGFAYSR